MAQGPGGRSCRGVQVFPGRIETVSNWCIWPGASRFSTLYQNDTAVYNINLTAVTRACSSKKSLVLYSIIKVITFINTGSTGLLNHPMHGLPNRLSPAANPNRPRGPSPITHAFLSPGAAGYSPLSPSSCSSACGPASAATSSGCSSRPSPSCPPASPRPRPCRC